jgi:hypothetical protein
MAQDQKIAFLHDRPVPTNATCAEYVVPHSTRCGRAAVMLVRVDGQEYFVCYHHLSLLYNRSHK